MKMDFHYCQCLACLFEWMQSVKPVLCPKCHSDKTILTGITNDNLPPRV